jgi:hypothetical protein
MREIEYEYNIILVFALDSIVQITYNRSRHYGQEANLDQVLRNLEQKCISFFDTRHVYLMSKIPLENLWNFVPVVVYQRNSLFPPLETRYMLRPHY